MKSYSTVCPCKRTKCERHGNCSECMLHHRNSNKQPLTACERKIKKEERAAKREEKRSSRKN